MDDLFEEPEQDPNAPMVSSYYSHEHLEASLDKPIDSSNIGFRLLAKMGWTQGQGLGRLGQGIKEPIRMQLNVDGLGLGKAEEAEKYINPENINEFIPVAIARNERSEIIGEEEQMRRLEKAKKQEELQQHLKSITESFYCELCTFSVLNTFFPY